MGRAYIERFAAAGKQHVCQNIISNVEGPRGWNALTSSHHEQARRHPTNSVCQAHCDELAMPMARVYDLKWRRGLVVVRAKKTMVPFPELQSSVQSQSNPTTEPSVSSPAVRAWHNHVIGQIARLLVGQRLTHQHLEFWRLLHFCRTI